MPTNIKMLAVNVKYNPQQDRFEDYKRLEDVKACNRWVVLKGVRDHWTASLAARQLSIILNTEQFGGTVDIGEAIENLDVLADCKDKNLSKSVAADLVFIDKGKIVKQVDKDGNGVRIKGVVYHADDYQPKKRAAADTAKLEAKAEAKARANLVKTVIEGSNDRAELDRFAIMAKITAEELDAALKLNPPSWITE